MSFHYHLAAPGCLWGCLPDHLDSFGQPLAELAGLIEQRPRQNPGPEPGGLPLLADDGEPLGTFDLTYYWVASERDEDSADTELFDLSCDPIATVSRAFAEKVA